jgi:oxalate decarboxylase/phosphoglucose isomerase-like protein (cupin superfamily)
MLSSWELIFLIFLIKASSMSEMFTKTVLYTSESGHALFKTEELALGEGKPEARLSALMPSSGYQLRKSPVGFKSEFHCTTSPQWVFILSGQMHIGLQSGEGRTFKAGEHFFSADTLPEGATFDPKIHGHWSCQVGAEPLVTLFVRA